MERWSVILVFDIPAEVARLFWKTNEAEKWEIRDVFIVLYGNFTYPFWTFPKEKPISVAILSENFASYSIVSEFVPFLVCFTLMHSF